MKKIHALVLGIVSAAVLLATGCVQGTNTVDEGGEGGDKIVDPGKNPAKDPDDKVTGAGKFWHNFEGCGMQVWANSFGLDFDTGVLSIGTSDDGWNWWGGAVGAYNAEGSGFIEGASYDLSNVDHVTFTFNPSADISTMYLLVGDPIGEKDKEDNKTVFTAADLAAGTRTITIPHDKINPSSTTKQLITFGGSGDDNGTKVGFGNVAFWDADGNEVVLTLNTK